MNRRLATQARREEDVRRLEDELKDPSNFLEYLIPRGIRKWLFAAGLTSSGIGAALALAQGISSEYGREEALQTSGVNLLGLATFAFLLRYDIQSEGARIERRREVRERQIAMGDRDVYRNEDGIEVSRLKDVDIDWIIKRLERWGKQDQMPFVGPKKGEILKSIVQEKQPKSIVEVGTLAGYSALLMAKGMLEGGQNDGKIVTVEKDLLWWLVANRFVFQAADGTPELKGKISVWLGDAEKKIREMPDKSIDLLFLDGIPREYLGYLKAAEPKLAPGAIIVADNAGVFKDGGLKDYLEYVRNTPGRYASEFVESTLEWREDVIDGMEITTLVPSESS